MKKKILLFVTVGMFYLLVTFLYSCFFDLPPFNHGIVIGYPTIYYSFYVSPTEIQYGIIGINIFYNLFIIFVLYFFIQLLIKRRGR